MRLALAIVLLCPFASAQWTKTNGPYGGNVSCFAVSDTNVFAGTGWNGIYLSTNNGTSWTAVDSGLPQYTRVNALVASGTKIFAGTDSGLFESTDNGSGWTIVSAGLSHPSVAALAITGTNLFAGTSQGVFVSTDNGVSWIQPNDMLNTKVRHFAVTGNSVFATDGSSVFRSTDGGSSWTIVGKGFPYYVTGVSAIGAAFSQVYAIVQYQYCDGCYAVAVCRSSDNGENWTTSGMPMFNILLQHDANLLAVTNNGVLLSTDQGTSWTVINDGLPQSPYVNALIVSGTNIFAATYQGTFRSTNNGSNWTAVNTGLTTTIGVSNLAVIGTNLFADVFLSADNGTSWTASGLSNYAVSAFAVSGTIIFAGTYGGMLLSTDNGSSWTTTGLREDAHVLALAVSGTNLFAATNGGTFLSSNNGTTWTPVDSGGFPPTSADALATSGTNIFAGTYDGIFLSTNNGASWTAVSNGLPQYNHHVTAFAVSGSNLFAAISGSGVFITTNNGTSWTAVNTGLPISFLVFALAVSGSNLFAGTYSDGVFLSTNNGTSWTGVNTGLPQSASINAFAFSRTNVFAATGYGVWRRTLSELVSVQHMLSVLPKQFDLTQNYPNPFNPNTTIQFQLPHSSWVSLKMYNTLGQEVALLVDEHKDAGYYQVQWNASKVPSGIYFYRLQAGNFVEVKKMLLVK